MTDDPLTLETYRQEVLAEATRRFAESAAYESIMRQSAFYDMLMMGYVPPTKWQRRRRKIAEFFGRFKLAWRVLRGDDIYEDYC